MCCTPVGTENLLGLLSPARDEALEKSLNRSVLLDLGLEVLSEAGNHFAGHGAGDLLLRRLPSRMVLLDEESFVKGLDVSVGFLCHKFLDECAMQLQGPGQRLGCFLGEHKHVGGVRVCRRLESDLNDITFPRCVGPARLNLNMPEDCPANFAVDFHCS